MFCERMAYTAVPATRATITRYAAFLARSLKFNSIKQYINIVRIMHLEWDLPNPLQDNFFISGVLCGIRRSIGDIVHSKLPITPRILLTILARLNLSTPFDANFWSICLIMFYGLLRKASVLPSVINSDMDKTMCRDDITFHPWGILLHVRTTKTIQYQERTLDIPIPRYKKSPLCPVQATFHAFSCVSKPQGRTPAFMIPGPSGLVPITGPMFVRRLNQCLHESSLPCKSYSGHSLRRGGATWMYQAGVPTETIRALGDWRSSAYLKYITVAPEQLYKGIQAMQEHI